MVEDVDIDVGVDGDVEYRGSKGLGGEEGQDGGVRTGKDVSGMAGVEGQGISVVNIG